MLLVLTMLAAAAVEPLRWWTNGRPTAQAWAVVTLLQHADEKGLDPADYDGGEWFNRLLITIARGEPDMVAGYDVELTKALMRYARDLAIGRVNPHRFRNDVELSRREEEITEIIARIVDGAEPAVSLAALEPVFPAYTRTLQALHRYQELTKVAVACLPEDLRCVEDQLVALGDLEARAQPQTTAGTASSNSTDSGYVTDNGYTSGELFDAIRRFQQRHGLPPSGSIDPPTWKALSTPIAHRVHQLRLSLERMRWVSVGIRPPFILINVPEFRLHAFDNTRGTAFSLRVVVGQAYDHQTPLFSGMLQQIVFRPEWIVPRKIQDEELLPQLLRDPQNPRMRDFDILDRDNNIVTAPMDDELMERFRSGGVRLRQRSGERNALGLVKFVFPNSHQVYMHDTPSRELFSHIRRDFSHGCIRVEYPERLAAWLLADNPEWSAKAIDAAMHGTRQRAVRLSTPVPVLILYTTAVARAEGTVYFFDDVYGLDDALARSLTKRSAELRKHSQKLFAH